jgi:excisionase family DNA binding protein
MFGKEPKEIQELINAAIKEGKDLEDIEKQIGKFVIQEGDPEELKKQWERVNENYKVNQKQIEKELEDYKPYDLTEIGIIFHKAIKSCDKIKNLDKNIEHLSLALDIINQIIKNSKSVYQYLEQKYTLDVDPIDFQNMLEKAENLRKQIEIRIRELQFIELEGLGNYQEHKQKETSSVITSIFESKSYGEIMDVDELTEYLRYKHNSTVYHMVSKGRIPYIKHPGGAAVRFKKIEIDDWLKAGKPKKLIDKNKTMNCRFIFTELPELFTNVFFEHNYLDNENATRMNSLFSKEPKIGNTLILWKRSIKSLMTFIFISDRLGYIKSLDLDPIQHTVTNKEINYTDEIDEDYIEMKEINYLKLKENYFEDIKGSSEGNLTKIWNKINKAIIVLCVQVVKKINKKITRADAIRYYFENNKKNYILNKTKDEDIDMEMLEHMCRIYFDVNMKKPTNF